MRPQKTAQDWSIPVRFGFLPNLRIHGPVSVLVSGSEGQKTGPNRTFKHYVCLFLMLVVVLIYHHPPTTSTTSRRARFRGGWLFCTTTTTYVVVFRGLAYILIYLIYVFKLLYLNFLYYINWARADPDLTLLALGQADPRSGPAEVGPTRRARVKGQKKWAGPGPARPVDSVVGCGGWWILKGGDEVVVTCQRSQPQKQAKHSFWGWVWWLVGFEGWW